ncbi:MAG: hypothetical protein B6I38_03335 [Anaerolineaceae bacterium 4572_5.1]|nr:MAG: hypothetical protein B6I38_03335 [Anaerolineaceae bacterium 4572_5.1]RLD06244.1 MAG: hypothetical protein DRI56_08285 [Chloroflexota bacterium]
MIDEDNWIIRDGGRDCSAIVLSKAVADFDGDGDTDISVYRPSNGKWYVMGQAFTSWGLTGDIPSPCVIPTQTETSTNSNPPE